MLTSSARRPARGGICRSAVAVVLLGLVLAGCSEGTKAAPPASPTPIARLNTVAMQVPRIEFCGLVPRSAITAALGGKPDSDAAYGNGDEEELPDIGSDVVHEIGCSWTGKDGVSARAWVFARPISASFAGTVIASGGRTQGCRRVSGPAYGTPSMTQLCRFADGGQRLRHAGLFGQTWLTCELAGSGAVAADMRARADAWCVEVANTLNTAR